MEVKNYNQPVDASLFPEGCPRCSLLKFLLHLVPVAAVGLWGAYAAFRVLAHGLGEVVVKAGLAEAVDHLRPRRDRP